MFLIGSGNWNNGSNAGVFARIWYSFRSARGSGVGFRCAFSDSVSILTFLLEILETKGVSYPAILAKSARHIFLVPYGKVGYA